MAAKAQLINSALCIASLATLTSAQIVLAQEPSNGEATKESTNSEKLQLKSETSAKKSSFGFDPCSGPAWLQNKDKWSIAKTNVDKFFELDETAIGNLFGCRDFLSFKDEIELGENTSLRVSGSGKVKSFYFGPKNFRFSLMAFGHDFDMSKGRPETIWTGAKRKDEKEYWKIIKANLDKFIGMSSEEIVALLGPERCSNKGFGYITYRIGDAGLTFDLKDGKVKGYRLEADQFIPGT